MNLSTPLRKLVLYLVLFLVPAMAWSQIEYHEVLVNDSLYYNFESVGNAAQIDDAPSNGDFVFNGQLNQALGIAGLNELIYIPNTDYLGTDTIKILYYEDGPTGPIASFRTLVIDVIESYVLAVNDYTATPRNTATTLDVLINDVGSGNLTLSNVPLSNNGTVELVNGEIIFTPASEFTGMTNISYTVCDEDTEVCDVATVTVFVQSNTALNDTTVIVTLRNQSIPALFPNDNGILQLTAPEHGNIQITDGGVEYTPNQNYVGRDTFSYAYDVNGTTSIATFSVDILDAPDENSLVKEDFAYAARHDSVEFNVLANDLNNDLAILTFTQSDRGGTVTHLGDGNFKYVPSLGFNGIDFFEYTAFIPGTSAQETGKAYITVNNQLPALIAYELSTPKNTPAVINYGATISNFEFTIVEQSGFGEVVYYPGDSTIEVNGQEVTGYNLLVYYPDADYTGTDDFEIEYCVGDDCKIVLINSEVKEILSPQADTLCVTDCVWPGDTNGDGSVDTKDILPLGYCLGEVGNERNNGVTEWYGQFADDWSGEIGETGINLKNVDANGDGYISHEDTAAINLSYGQYSQVTVEPAPISTQIPLFFVPRTPNPQPGDKVIIDIVLGTDNLPAQDVHGITFALNFNQDIVTPGTMEVNYTSNNWLAYESTMLSLTKEPILGRVESGYTRGNGISKHGYGIIGQVGFIVVEDLIDGNRTRDTLRTTFRPEATIAMNAAGQYINLVTQNFELGIARELPEEFEDDNRNLIVFPNPTTDLLNIHVNGNNELEQVIVHSLTGQEVYRSSANLSGKQTNITFDERMASGIYLVTAICDKGVYTQKVELIK